ncbi:MAG: GAL4 enhancer protein [Chaenotheca gracillima]|nr:MAG: GAL4 enhancer protein [Chaenotheca gracillima]
MVGVPGRSKGCGTCRKRRVKCDETHPTCDRCHRGGFNCAGYARESVFIDATPGSIGGVKKEGLKGTRKSSEKAPQTVRSSSANSRNSSASSASSDLPPSDSSKRSLNGTVVPFDAPASSPASRSSSLIQFLPYGHNEDLVFRYLAQNLFAGSSNMANFHTYQAVENRRAIEGSLTLLSSRALAVLYFAKMNGVSSIMREGLGLYSKALKRLNRALQDKHEVRKTETYESVSVLNLFELISFTSDEGWVHHALGMGRLIELRGPHVLQNPIDRRIYEETRINVVLGALAARKRTFLEQEPWKTVPWALTPHLKSSQAYLEDVLVEIPGMLEQLEHLKAVETMTPESIAALHADLKPRVDAALRTLVEWRKEWDVDHPGSCEEFATELVSGLTVDEEGQPLFDTVLMFKNLERVADIGYYFAGLILLILAKERLSALKSDDTAPTVEREPPAAKTNPLYWPSDPPDMVDAHNAAAEICRLVDYNLLPQHRSLGSLQMIFPIRIALHVPSIDSSPLGDWLKRIVHSIMNAKKGLVWGVGQHLLQMRPL